MFVPVVHTKDKEGRKHYSVEEYKKITNYENTKKILKEMKLELPEVPDINDKTLTSTCYLCRYNIYWTTVIVA